MSNGESPAKTEHRWDFLRIRDDDGRIFSVCLDCGARKYEQVTETRVSTFDTWPGGHKGKNMSEPLKPLSPQEVDALKGTMVTPLENRLLATVRNREREAGIAWRSSEDWERQAGIYERERDEAISKWDTQTRTHAASTVSVATERDELQRQLAEARKALELYAEPTNWKCARCGKHDPINCFCSKYVGPLPLWDGEAYSTGSQPWEYAARLTPGQEENDV